MSPTFCFRHMVARQTFIVVESSIFSLRASSISGTVFQTREFPLQWSVSMNHRRIRPRFLVRRTIKIMYFDGTFPNQKATLLDSQTLQQVPQIDHDRLLAPVPYCVNNSRLQQHRQLYASKGISRAASVTNSMLSVES